MKHIVNIEDMKPDEDRRSLRFAVKDRASEILRDTYYLINAEESPSENQLCRPFRSPLMGQY